MYVGSLTSTYPVRLNLKWFESNQHGATGIFGLGTPMDDIIQFIRSNVKTRGIPA